MDGFMKMFIRVAEKYAEYVESRIKEGTNTNTEEPRPGMQMFAEEKETRGYAAEMRTLNQTAQTLMEYDRYKLEKSI